MFRLNIKTILLNIVWLLLVLAGSTGYGQNERIFLDGEFSDWQTIPVLYSDPIGDPITGALDFGRLWAANDEYFLYLRLEVSTEINMQDLNEISIFIDTDNNSNTGMPAHGIGAELQWNFGNRSGTFTSGGNPVQISQGILGVYTAPTVSSTEFEIAFDRFALPDGQNLLFSGNDIRIVFEDGLGGDILPDNPGGVLFSFSNDPLPPLPVIAIANQHPGSTRFLSYNVQFDGLFDPTRSPQMVRMLQAIQPEIIGFQEIFSHSSQETHDVVESALPSSGGRQWYHAKAGSDNIAISRYPILASFAIAGWGGSSGNGAFLIDLRPTFNSDLLFVVAHPPCCGNNIERQWEIDAIMAFIRDAKLPGGVLTLDNNSPIIIVGDMNLVGFAQQLTTLLTGEIINTGIFGQPFSPDWDGSDFADLIPQVLNRALFFTWNHFFSAFSPGRLDFMIYSNSVIENKKGYVLFTPFLSADTLSAYNLQQLDATSASDHIPVVGDFVFLPTTGITSTPEYQQSAVMLGANFPNPFNPSTNIRYSLLKRAKIKLAVFNLLGQEIKTLVNNEQTAGDKVIVWDGKNSMGKSVSSGLYIYRLFVSAPDKTSPVEALSKKMLLIR